MGVLFGYTKVDIAISNLKEYEPVEGYFLAFSGGKDSCVVAKLAELAGVRYEKQFRHIGLEPIELLRFIRKYHPATIWTKPPVTWRASVIKNGVPPSYNMRYCCEELKEDGHGINRLLLMGTRRVESRNQHNRQLYEPCYTDPRKQYLNIIIDWTDEEVWQFIGDYDVPVCELYKQGYDRIGCVLCPLKSNKKRQQDAIRYPNWVRAWIHVFDDMLVERRRKGLKTTWKTGKAVYDWWMQDGRRFHKDIGDDFNFL